MVNWLNRCLVSWGINSCIGSHNLNGHFMYAWRLYNVLWSPWYYITCHYCHGQRRLCILSCNLFDICCGKRGIRWESLGLRGVICCIAGRTSLNTSVFPTLLQRGGKDRMLEYTRKILMICTGGKIIQIKRITQWLNLYYFRQHHYNSSDPFIGIRQGYKTLRLGNRHPNRSGSGSVQLYRICPSE